jgi:hypothetical protein
MGSAQQTVTAPDGSIVSGQIANATLALPSGLTVAANTGIGTTSPDGALHAKGISDHGRIVIEAGGTTGSTNNTFINFHNSGGTEVSQITVEETATNEGQMVFKTGGTTTAMTIDKDGHITKPLQSAFHVRKGSSANTDMVASSYNTITFGTEVFDQNGDFASNTFTAPITGKYYLGFNVRLESPDSSCTFHYFEITTSNFSYAQLYDQPVTDGCDFHGFSFSVLADMDASDTAKLQYYQIGGTNTSDVTGYDAHAQFYGYLVA